MAVGRCQIGEDVLTKGAIGCLLAEARCLLLLLAKVGRILQAVVELVADRDGRLRLEKFKLLLHIAAPVKKE